ncbi:MAG: hypothetical protein ABR596_04220 [Halarsenatibacteraceae bacterium]
MEKASLSKIKPIMEKLNTRRGRNFEDAYICTREIFKLVYQLEKRRVRRNKSPVFIVTLQVIGEGLTVEELDKIASRILDIFKKQLRPNDVVCRLDENNFVVLINNIDNKTIQGLMEKINYFFYSLSNINYRKSWIDIFNRTGLIWYYKIIEADRSRKNIKDYEVL